MRAALAIVLTAGVSLAAAVGRDATTASAREPNPAPTEVVVTADRPEAPGHCGPGPLGRQLLRFNRALNAADTRTLRRIWKEERDGLRNDRGPHARGTFRWFSITNSPSPTHEDHFAAFQPRRAVRYVGKREGFRMQLTEVSGGAIQGLWISDDGRTYEVLGKADFRCKRRPFLIRVWSMAVHELGTFSSDLCPDPPGGAPPGTLISCAPPRFWD